MSKPANALFALLLLLTACNVDPKEQFAHKKRIGVCQENQGMVTFEAMLYSDSTFYIPDDGLVGYSFGRFQIKGKQVLFVTEGGETHFCEKYSYNRTEEKLEPVHCPDAADSEILYLYFDKI